MEDDVSTSMDQLIGLLEKDGTIKISEAASELNTDKSHIESWAKMLEKEGIVQVHYSVVGGAFIRRGQKFDSLVKESAAASAASSKASAASAAATASFSIKPTQNAKPAAAGVVQPAPQEYSLIRKRIDESEISLEDDLKKLSDEQARIVQYMGAVITEGRKLEEYIESLRQIVEKTNEKRDDKLALITKS